MAPRPREARNKKYRNMTPFEFCKSDSGRFLAAGNGNTPPGNYGSKSPSRAMYEDWGAERKDQSGRPLA